MSNKVITVNIPPKEKSAPILKYNTVTDTERIERIKSKIDSLNPDIIFFVEQYRPIFNPVKDYLSENFNFFFPDDFENSQGYAGIVAAVKANKKVTKFSDGNDFVEKSAKWLSIDVNGKTYLGIHSTQPENADFHKAVKYFASKFNPSIILGDFNPEKNTNISIQNYINVLPNESTSAFNTKLDYLFVLSGLKYQNIIFEKDCMSDGKKIFSDHAITGIQI